MDTRTENRLTELEIKASFMDDMIEELNKVITRQQETLDLLVRELADLKARAGEAAGALAGDATARALAERPPHY
jgi:SlyX protein